MSKLALYFALSVKAENVVFVYDVTSLSGSECTLYAFVISGSFTCPEGGVYASKDCFTEPTGFERAINAFPKITEQRTKSLRG
ncbi:hypothetical protein DNTS_002271 [Danionella cerebrum]|uniref:Uncharacterized protein n=1 Tax=Danionella cerebrum TaxID=2873325 RepID=A0A553Q4G9_9TELE|nr:hypothetical protein DNTS_002271 [Danionella translucida]